MQTKYYFEEKFPEISSKVFRLEENGFQTMISRKGVSISLPEINKRFFLGNKHLEQLEKGDKISGLSGLTYYEHCGFSFEDYSEFFISIKHPDYYYLDLPSEWPASEPLKFCIDNIIFYVDTPSPLILLLTEPAYLDREFYPDGFSALASIMILRVRQTKCKGYLHKALYYLNSHYLKTIGMYSKLFHVNSDFDDPLGIYYGIKEPEDEFMKITRKRIRQRYDFKNCEPLILYNKAQELENEEKFLLYYRILEFFFDRHKLKIIDRLRNDITVSNEKLIDAIYLKSESQHLTSLLHEITTPALKKKLSNYAFHQNLIDKAQFKLLSEKLYGFRNSIVHAKEKQIHKTLVPNPFQLNTTISQWSYIVRVLSEQAISKLNKS